ncbi:MAG: dihydrofolate reductase family protein [Bacteroidota bacterium]|nr:dihydrofolate reductase family protein [Bacteroidota bacterium]
MRKITVFSMVSLDGVMQAPGGRDEDRSGGFEYGGWTAAFSDELSQKLLLEEFQSSDYLFGRKTFEIFEGYWPHHNDFWPAINEGNKYVLSKTRNQSDWQHSGFLSTIEEVKALKQSEGKDFQVWGSSELVQLLLENDLVDVLRLKTYPILLGKGKRLFDHKAMPAAFRLTESQVNSKGVIIATYHRAGSIVTGDINI